MKRLQAEHAVILFLGITPLVLWVVFGDMLAIREAITREAPVYFDASFERMQVDDGLRIRHVLRSVTGLSDRQQFIACTTLAVACVLFVVARTHSKRRREQHGGQISSEGAPSAPPNESSP